MASQGFFSGSESAEKRRFAGQKENNANLSTRVEPVKVANLYNNQTPSVTYPKDDVGEYIKDSETKFPSTTYTTSSGDIYTKKPYTESTPGYKFYNVPDAQLIRKKRDDPNFTQQYSTASDRENFLKERNAYLRDTGQSVPRDPNKDFEGKPLKTITGPLGLIRSGLLFRKGFQDEGAKEYASFLDKNASYDYKMYRQNMRDKVFSESSYGEDVEKGTIDKPGYYYKDFQKPGVYRSEEDVKSYIKDRGAFLTDMPSNFEGGISGRGEKSDDLSSMYRSTAGDEKSRLEKAKKEQENRNILQRVGDFVGDTFNKLTGTQAAGAETLQAQGINTSATTNIAQMGVTPYDIRSQYPEMQRAKAEAMANLRRSGLDKTVGGQSSQANYGSGRKGGFGTGTHGKGMPSNPKGMRQTGVGKSASNLSRHSTGHSSGRKSGGSGGRSGGSGGSSGSSGSSSSKSSSSKSSSSKSSSSKSSGGFGGGVGNRTNRRGSGFSKRRCDIRCKIDIAQLTNTDLFRDDLADIAYFVKEIK